METLSHSRALFGPKDQIIPVISSLQISEDEILLVVSKSTEKEGDRETER